VLLTTVTLYLRSPSIAQTNVSQPEFRITYLGAPREAKWVNKHSETDRPLFVTNNRCIPVKNTLGLSSFVFCACEIIQVLFSVVCWVGWAVHKLYIRLFIKRNT
jgi:hypothetical protein